MLAKFPAIQYVHMYIHTCVRVSVLTLGNHLWHSPGLHNFTGVLKIDITGFIGTVCDKPFHMHFCVGVVCHMHMCFPGNFTGYSFTISFDSTDKCFSLEVFHIQ